LACKAGAIGGTILLASVLAGCWRTAAEEVVIYTALDAEFSRPLLERFERQRGVRVLANYDVESTKTVGLVTRLLRERNRPRCDVFWNNEILHTLRLKEEGLLQPYQSPAGQALPQSYQGSDGMWYGFAARARVLIVNTELVSSDQRPRSIHDLLDPQWSGRVGVAKPLFGTTATHAAVLFSKWGSQRAEQFFRQLKENVRIMSGNKQVARSVAEGQLAFGLTDTDDAIIELEQGRPVEMVFPDQGPEAMGTLRIPNTVCILRGAPHEQAARELVEYLLSPEVETALAKGPSAQFPVNPQVEVSSRVPTPEDVHWMEVDFEAAAAHWDQAAQFLRDLFGAAN
jgi:iron(III) transport system substrate-binding protein